MSIFTGTLPPSDTPPRVQSQGVGVSSASDAVDVVPATAVKWVALDDLPNAALSTWACKALSPALPASASYVHKRAKTGGKSSLAGGAGDGDDDNDSGDGEDSGGEGGGEGGGSSGKRDRRKPTLAVKRKITATAGPKKKQSTLKF